MYYDHPEAELSRSTSNAKNLKRTDLIRKIGFFSVPSFNYEKHLVHISVRKSKDFLTLIIPNLA
jgi:hypothetical protein